MTTLRPPPQGQAAQHTLREHRLLAADFTEEDAMAKYEWSDDMREISGFGGGYEATCRAMLVAGLEWFDALPKETAEPTFKQLKNVTGIIIETNPAAKGLTAAMLKAPGGRDCTGAMMQFCVYHVLTARELGWAAYADKMRELKRAEEQRT